MWGIDLKVWNEFKSNLSSASLYLKEFLLFALIISLIVIITFDYTWQSVLLILLVLLFLILLLNGIGKKRSLEINEIKSIISNIRSNQYRESEQITLKHNLKGMQDEIRQMFEKARNDIDYLQKLEKMRTEFLANVSHELRTPIFAIQGYIETLINGAIDDKNVNRNFLDKANHHTLNLSNLLNDLIDISMIESGEMRMSYRYFNFNEYMIPLIQELKPMAKEKNIELVYIPIRESLQLFGDKNRLRQVFVNLIQNAIKYTEEGKVEVLVEEENKFAKIIIRDTGIGIPAEDVNRIFERFYRVDKARSKAAGGTGLGLAIVKHILDAHGTKIEVNSEVGKGSEFSFRLKK